MPRVQEALAGRYQLIDLLGRGGMGEVYRARDRVLGRTVAVKVLPAERAEDPTFVARFQREARAAASLSHPNVVAVFDTGHDQGIRFIVMECAPGQSLAALLRREGPLPISRAAEIAAGIADALSAAHRVGIVHRDVKPANVMVDGRAGIKVLDFGIARAAADTSLTRTAMVLGSAPYLAPEVTRGEPAGERSDIYSLGCVLYEMLTGRPPFTGENPVAVMHQHNSAAPVDPSELNPAVPAALAALVLRMLAKRADERLQTAQEVARELQSLDGARSATQPTAVMAPRRRLPRGERLALAAAALLAIAGMALALALSGQSHTNSAGPRTTTPPRTTSSAPRATAPAATDGTTPTTTASPPRAASQRPNAKPRRAAPPRPNAKPTHGEHGKDHGEHGHGGGD